MMLVFRGVLLLIVLATNCAIECHLGLVGVDTAAQPVRYYYSTMMWDFGLSTFWFLLACNLKH
jgi:hypothetical protein